MRGSSFLIPLLLFATGCMNEACDEYVDYICTCHADDPEFDCDLLAATYENADAATQEDCALALDEQQEEDAAEHLECSW
ncbi:MAG: hypothetical protein JXB39_13605 [Deltaproteobacteria bacterium]|nr:hypothetical protein [Deltaproteobacteria bacterium]